MSVAVGTVIERPTGELAFLWQAYARGLEKIERLQKQLRDERKRKKYESNQSIQTR